MPDFEWLDNTCTAFRFSQALCNKMPWGLRSVSLKPSKILKEPMLCFEFEQLWAPGCIIFSCRERLKTKTNEPFKMKVHGLGCVYSIYHNFASTRGSTWLFWIIIFQVQYQRQIHNTLFLKRLKDWRNICEGVWTNTSWI